MKMSKIVKGIGTTGDVLGTIGTAISVTTTVLGLVGSVIDKKQQNKLIKDEVAREVAKAINKK